MIEWPELGQKVKASLCYKENPGLCQEIWNALPMESIQNHASSSGSGIFAWVPLVSHATVQTYENIKDAPVGRMRYLFTTGNKISIQYGPCSEDKMAPMLGMVDKEDVFKLPAIGAAIWNAFMLTKQPVHVRYIRLDKNDNPEPFHYHEPFLKSAEGASEAAIVLAQKIQKAAFANYANENAGLKRIRTGGNKSSGAGGQYFSSWDTAAGMLRDYSQSMYQYTQITRSGQLDAEQLKFLYKMQIPLYIGVMNNNGLDEHERLAAEVSVLLQEPDTSLADIQTVTDALCMYTQSLESWMWFHFPWGLGAAFRFPEK
ncbi:MAG: hypothetical protein VB106_16710 [Clostridiaceae bacterium]|jgi:hypothetical protein|nr:hypothetical protein [Clostridiaceae bacterium]